MHHKAFLRLALFLVPALLLLGLLTLYLLLQSQQGLARLQQQRFDYFEAAGQIRMLSGQLSARIRNYTYSGSEQAQSAYHHALAMTEGRVARSNGRIQSNEQLLRGMVLTREERNLLERARQATLTLARLEAEALRLMETGRHAQARQKVFNADYDRYRELVSEAVDQFIVLLVTRLDSEIEREQQQQRHIMAAMISVLLLLLLTCLGLVWSLRGRGISRYRFAVAGHQRAG